MLKKVYVLLLLTLAMFLTGSLTEEASAEDLFSVKPVLKENQVEGIENYVYVKTNGKDLKETFDYAITNRTEEPMTLSITPLNAVTSPNGSIQYIDKTQSSNSTIVDVDYALTKYIDKIPDITVGPSETAYVSIPVEIPKLQGQLLGGFGFKTLSEGKSMETEGISLKINNELNTVLAFMVEFNETQVNPNEITFDEPYIETFPTYFAVRLPISANISKVVDNATITYEVLDGDGNKIFETKQGMNVNLVPQSQFDYIIPWDSDKIKVNESYIIKGTLSFISAEGLAEIPIEKVVTFSRKDIQADGKQLNKIGTTIEGSTNTKYYYLGGGLILFVIICLIVAKLYRVNQENKSMKKLLLEEQSATTHDEANYGEYIYDNNINSENGVKISGYFIENVVTFYAYNKYKFSNKSDYDYFCELALDNNVYVVMSEFKNFHERIDFELDKDLLKSPTKYYYSGEQNERYAGVYQLNVNSNELSLIGYCEMKY